MAKNYVVVAHFNALYKFDENFKLFLSCLEVEFDKVVVVSTSRLIQEDVLGFPEIIFIGRPNVGYDFYSYKVGYEHVLKNYEAGNILFTNSSFYVLNPKIFQQTLKFAIKSVQSFDVVGLTSSKQISWHLQSYFIFINSWLLKHHAIHNFFKDVQPLNSKFELILQYELGLSKLFTTIGVRCFALYKISFYAKILAYIRWGKRLYVNSQKKWKFIEAVKECRKLNLTHFCSREIAYKFGIIKSEVVRTNPHKLSIKFISKFTMPEILINIDNSINLTKSMYKNDHTGLTNFISTGYDKHGFMPIYYGERGRIGVRIAVVIHLFYFDLLEEISSYLDAIIEPYDLYVTTPFQSDISEIINKMSSKAISVTVLLGENRGRDIGPFVTLYRSGFLDNYFAVLKIHSKKSKYSSEGEKWRKLLYQSVVGTSRQVRKTLQAFETGSVGMAGPGKYYLTNGTKFWGANYETVKKILHQTDKFDSNYEPKLAFFAGSMFWFAPKAFKDIQGLPDNMVNFDIENGMQDGTLAHAYERLFCLITRAAGFTVTSVDLAGKEINEQDFINNNVPVL